MVVSSLPVAGKDPGNEEDKVEDRDEIVHGEGGPMGSNPLHY